MVLWKLFFTNPIMACALVVCLATIYGCILILHKRHRGPDRFMAALIGIICIWQGLRILRESGVIAGSHTFDTFTELIITGLYLTATIILRMSVTERKTAALRLRLEEANGQLLAPFVKLETPEPQVSEIILWSNPMATIALDKSGKVTYWNPAAEHLLGWKADEVVGKTSPVAMSSPLQTKNGSTIRFESWCSPLHDAVGRACGSVVMIAPRADRGWNRVMGPPILAAAGFPGGTQAI